MAEPKDDRPQSDKFKELARKLRADEDEAAFEETVRKVASPSRREPPKDPKPG